MNALQHPTLRELCCALFFSLLIAIPAQAETPPDEWWGGEWNCEIAGRSAYMKWSMTENSPPAAGGSAMATRWQGSLSTGDGGQPVALTEPSQGKKGGLYFRHADGHKWYLQKPVGNKATGWTRATAQRNSPRDPIACWR